MMRVAFVAPSLGEAEGQGRVDLELVRRLLDRGIDVHVFTSRVPSGGIPGARVRLAPRPFGAELLNQLLFVLWSRLVVRRHHFNVVHADGASLLSRADVRVAHMLHTAWRRLPASARTEPGLRGAYHRFSSALNARLERSAYRRSRIVLANSERTANDLTTLLGIPSERIRVLPLGVDSDRFRVPTPEERAAARAQLGASDDEFVTVLVGAAEPRKGVGVAIDAIAGMEGSRLVVVGDTRDGRYVRLAHERSVAATFVEWPADPLTYYWAADALIAPAAYEPFGLWVLEGMACGLPGAIAGDSGVAGVCDGSALHVRADADEFRRALETLRTDIARRHQMSTLARSLAASRPWDDAADVLLATWKEVSR